MREEMGTRVKVEDLSLLGSGRKCGPNSEGFWCVIYVCVCFYCIIFGKIVSVVLKELIFFRNDVRAEWCFLHEVLNFNLDINFRNAWASGIVLTC